jgi:hypothetical protein
MPFMDRDFAAEQAFRQKWPSRRDGDLMPFGKQSRDDGLSNRSRRACHQSFHVACA